MRIVKDRDKLIRELADLRYKRGYSRTSLVQYVMDTYGIKEQAAAQYVRDMMERTAESYHRYNENALSEAIEFMEQMKQKAVGQGNDKLALEWAKELHKVSQLYVEKVMHEVKGVEGINITIKRDKDE